MSKKNAPLPNQLFFPVCDLPCWQRPEPIGTDTSTSPADIIPFAAGRPNAGASRILADARRAKLSRLRDEERQSWFVDDDPDDITVPRTAAAAEAGSAAAAETAAAANSSEVDHSDSREPCRDDARGTSGVV